MRFARLVYLVAGIYGLLVVSLGYVGYLAGADPALMAPTRPEYVHGFFLVCLPWQLLFILISRDPARYTSITPVTVLEKLPFAAVAMALFERGQANQMMGIFGAIDGVLGVLFCLSYWMTRRRAAAGD